MVKVHDNRKCEDRMLEYIEIDGYFMYQDVLCRRITLSDEIKYTDDGIPVIEVSVGRVWILDRSAWVLPLRDEQICVSIEDWG